MAKKTKVYTGFGEYSKPLLVSYPRSGTNWIRYIIEFLSGKPTPGGNRLVRGNFIYRLFNGYVIDRAHNADYVMHKHPAVVLIIRDYKDCLIRQFKSEWTRFDSVEEFLTAQELKTPCSWYINNIQAFEKYNGPKTVLYYEDMINKPVDFINQLAQFLNLPEKKLNHLTENLSFHQDYSVSLYTKKGHKSYTTGNSKKSHKQGLTNNQKTEFDEFYFKRYPELAKKYLSRYLN